MNSIAERETFAVGANLNTRARTRLDVDLGGYGNHVYD
jgi:hypothetical protein